MHISLVNGALSRTALLAGAFLAASCTELPPAPVTPAAVRIQILPGCESVPQCRQCTLTIAAFDKNGQPTLPPALTWTSSNAGIAIVNSSGTVTGLRPGGARIRASNPEGTISAERSVSILPVNSACTPPS
ncbi:MAG: hypothetical protein H0W36_09300 [Gemmatimonadetes bacterium]|nr:hypothetical protein [Gemmatimonadota bacterium]